MAAKRKYNNEQLVKITEQRMTNLLKKLKQQEKILNDMEEFTAMSRANGPVVDPEVKIYNDFLKQYQGLTKTLMQLNASGGVVDSKNENSLAEFLTQKK